ncbi:hypothetical protein GJ496_011931 [Pomphorhynchus laevis]|nr:hypothetical protein GJ496_011931 [Pomphorhynchus laevis]
MRQQFANILQSRCDPPEPDFCPLIQQAVNRLFEKRNEQSASVMTRLPHENRLDHHNMKDVSDRVYLIDQRMKSLSISKKLNQARDTAGRSSMVTKRLAHASMEHASSKRLKGYVIQQLQILKKLYQREFDLNEQLERALQLSSDKLDYCKNADLNIEPKLLGKLRKYGLKSRRGRYMQKKMSQRRLQLSKNVQIRSLAKCQFLNCVSIALPYYPYCLQHVDDDQVLFQRCTKCEIALCPIAFFNKCFIHGEDAKTNATFLQNKE